MPRVQIQQNRPRSEQFKNSYSAEQKRPTFRCNRTGQRRLGAQTQKNRSKAQTQKHKAEQVRSPDPTEKARSPDLAEEDREGWELRPSRPGHKRQRAQTQKKEADVIYAAGLLDVIPAEVTGALPLRHSTGLWLPAVSSVIVLQQRWTKQNRKLIDYTFLICSEFLHGFQLMTKRCQAQQEKQTCLYRYRIFHQAMYISTEQKD